jgi:hypothetical protein
MYLLCALPANDKTLFIVEQLFTLLLETYSPRVLRFSPETIKDKTQDVGQDIGNSVAMMEYAYYLSKVAEAAKAETGWPGACQSRGGDFGAEQGLNWSSPFMELGGYIPVIWTRTLTPDRERYIFRRGFPIMKTHASRMVFYISKSEETVFVHQLGPKVYGPEDKAQVSLIAEVMINGKPHPNPWSRLMGLELWDDWLKANSVALAVEWEKDGKRERKYLQSAGHYVVADDSVPGSIIPYTNAMALYRFFMQEVVQDPFLVSGLRHRQNQGH